jgi:hypothetical protein
MKTRDSPEEINSRDLWELLKKKLRRSYVKKVKKNRKTNETQVVENDLPRVPRARHSRGKVR